MVFIIIIIRIHQTISHQFNTVFGQDHGVENLFHLAADPLQSECANVLYIVRPCISLMKLIAEQIRHDKEKKVQKQYSVYFLPRRTVVCEKVLVYVSFLQF